MRAAKERRIIFPEPYLPLVFGITGHRDLLEEDREKLQGMIKSIFEDFMKRYPHTPLALLSPLAEGADRLAARAALDCGMKVVVPLPMDPDEYSKDFETPESKAEFNALLERASETFVMPFYPGNTPQSVAEKQEDRSEQYGLAGSFIVRYCEVLIALWDGMPATYVGGTAQIVDFRQNGLPDDYQNILQDEETSPEDYFDFPESGLVYHIVTRRKRPTPVNGEPFDLKICYPRSRPEGHEAEGHDEEEDAEDRFERIFSNIDGFNESVRFLERNASLEGLKRQSAGYLFPDSEASLLTPEQKRLRENYAVTDALAQYYQKLTLKGFKWMSYLVFLSVVSFELSAKLAPDNYWLALVFPLLLGVTYLYWIATMRRGNWQDRHQDYRALAEGLRVEFFWSLVTMPASVADHYLRKQKSELEWIRIAIQNLTGMRAQHAAPTSDRGKLGLVMEHWVQNQARYFAKSARRDHEELEAKEKRIQRLMLLSPMIAFLTALAGIVPSPLAHWFHDHENAQAVYAHKLLIVLVFVFAGVAGVIHNYVDKRALAQHAKQYERMSLLFGIAERKYKKSVDAGEFEAANKLLLELGKEALEENGSWLLMHRERPVDVPHAG
jgi:hypothetical protein